MRKPKRKFTDKDAVMYLSPYNTMNIVAAVDESLSKRGDIRYVVVDTDTHDILDDADGKGYETPLEAHFAWRYKKGNHDEKESKTQTA